MKHTIPSLSRAQARGYRPLLEHLEDRLPPGDAVIGNWLSMSWLAEAQQPAFEAGAVEVTRTADIAIVQTTDSTEDGFDFAVQTWDSLVAAEQVAALDLSAEETASAPLVVDFTGGEFSASSPAARHAVSADSTLETGAGANVREAEVTGPGSTRFVTESSTLVNAASSEAAALAAALNSGVDVTPIQNGNGGGTITDLGTAPDATGMGGEATTSSEYRFAASTDNDIITGRATELWARVYRPQDLSGGPRPLLVFLHGNHATCGRLQGGIRVDGNCQYTTTGTCPTTDPIVVPSHEGYGYVADQLASHGYIVVSINANRGITCGAGITGDSGLNLARGRLILKHLQRLSEWNTTGGAPSSICGTANCLVGTMNFNTVGLMGHSRGGEGIRAALNQYINPNRPGGWAGTTNPPPQWQDLIGEMNIQAMFEIGAVDGQTGVQLNAPNTPWVQLLPMCDGDVSNLQGVRPLDRMLRTHENDFDMKGSYTVWGANHNFYNSEWQSPDSSSCSGHSILPRELGGSAAQRTTGQASMAAFFRGLVGDNADVSFVQNFNPLYTLPAVTTDITRVDRSFVETTHQGATIQFEDFRNAAGTGMYGSPITTSGLSAYTHGVPPRHDPVQRAALVSWNTPGGFFQPNWLPDGTGYDMTWAATLDFRVARQQSALNPAADTNFSIQLVGADGSVSNSVQLSDWASLRGPVGGPGGIHPILQTVRIPVGEFDASVASQLRGVRLTFDGTGTGAIYLGNFTFSLFQTGAGPGPAPFSGDNSGGTPIVATALQDLAPRNTVVSLGSVSTNVDGSWQPGVEIELHSNRAFEVRNELAILKIGDREFNISRFPQCGETHTLVFTLTPEEFASLQQGAHMTVQYGHEAPANQQWHFGALDKAILNK